MTRLTLSLTALLLALAPAASAQVVVNGGGKAQACYLSVKAGNTGTVGAIRTCTLALSEDNLRSDTAATHVNRGVLYMRSDQQDKAIADYTDALKMQPDLHEAYINLGVSHYFSGNDDAALSALNTAIAAETEKMAIALYNRALVHDRMGDARSAYYDLKEALALEPEWEAAQTALSRYTVTRPES